MAQKMADDKKGNSAGFGRVDLTPPPYWIMTLLPHAPPGPEAALLPHPGPGEVLQQPLLLRQPSPGS